MGVIAYPVDCNPRVLFLKWVFGWVGVNSKNPLSLLKKNPKNSTFHITWGSIQEWGCNQADTVINKKYFFGTERHRYYFLISWFMVDQGKGKEIMNSKIMTNFEAFTFFQGGIFL